MKLDKISNQIYIVAYNEAKLQRHEFLTPEHILQASLFFDAGKNIIVNSGGDTEKIINELQSFFDQFIPKVDNEEPIETQGLNFLFDSATNHAISSGNDELKISDLLAALFNMDESFAVFILRKNGVKKLALLNYLSHNNNDLVTKKENVKLSSNDLEYVRAYAFDMTEKAYNNLIDPIIGREQIIDRTLQVLCRRTKNNPIHVGDPGVGKTAVVEGIALKIANGLVPEKLKNAHIFYLDMGAVIAGTRYRGDFEERLKKILETLSNINDSIIYIDEIHTVVGAGSVSGSAMDASNIIKPYLINSRLRFIGSTTYEEYRKYFEKDRALSRRFQKIEIQEPSIDDTFCILKGIKDKYEEYHNVKYSDDALYKAIVLSSKFIYERFLPDKAIDVIDEAGALANFENSNEELIITNVEIEKTISMIAKIPVQNIAGSELDKLMKLEENLKSKIFGQDEAITAVVNSIKRSRAGLCVSEKTVANLLFVGPTGVGKTEIAKQLSNFLSLPLIRFDMSEYQEKHSVARLIGSPPGYVGYEEGGLLTETIRKTPHCILLLDEIEKSHSDILNVLLQIMDYAKLTDSNGKKADFRNIVLIMTSNAGARDAEKSLIGFDSKKNISAITKAIEDIFSPEFRNRLDEVIIFNHINMEMALKISKKAISDFSIKLSEKGIILNVTDELLSWIAKKGLSKKYGAREILRIVEKDIQMKFVDMVLFNDLENEVLVNADICNDEIKIETEKNFKKI